MFNRNASLMVLAQWISTAGSQLHLLALPMIIYQRTGSTRLLALGFLAETLPWMILAPHLSPALSRFRSRSILIFADLIRTVLCVTLALAPFHGPTFLILMFGLGTLNSIYGTYRLRHLRAVTPEFEMQKVLAVATAGIETLQIVARALGASIVAFGWSAKTLMLIDGVSFVISSLIISFVRFPFEASTARNATNQTTTRKGFLTLWRSDALRAVTLSEGLRSAAEALFMPVMIILIERHHGLNNIYLGWSQTATSVGALAMAVGFIRLKGDYIRTLGPALSLAILAATKALYLLPGGPVYVLGLASILGVTMSFRQLSAELSIMENLDDSLSAVLISAYNSLISGAYIAGYATAAVMDSYVGGAVLASSLCLLGAAYQLALSRRVHVRAKALSAN